MKTLTTMHLEELKKLIQTQNKEMFQKETVFFTNFLALVIGLAMICDILETNLLHILIVEWAIAKNL
jgi:hypothetical protein